MMLEPISIAVIILALVFNLILVPPIVRADVHDVDRFMEEQIQRIYEFAELHEGPDKFPFLIEKLSQRLNEKVQSKDPAIVSGIRRILDAEEEPKPLESAPDNYISMSRFGRGPAPVSEPVGLSMVLAKADGADSSIIIQQNRSLSNEGLDILKKSFDRYLRARKPQQVILDTYEATLNQGQRFTARDNSLGKLFNGSKSVMKLLKDVMENLIGEKENLSVPLLFLEQVPAVGRILRKLRENHSQHISSAIRATHYAVEIANYITHNNGIKASDIKSHGIDLLRRNSKVLLKNIVDSLVKVDDSSSSTTRRFNMVVRLTYYIFVNCLSN